jgi:hypothetical protein
MQAVVQVICSKGPSLREKIVNDEKRLGPFGLTVSGKLKPGRQKGWAKIHSVNHSGALNIEWDSDTCTLICRVVNKRGGTPGEILGDLVAYLICHHHRRITVMNLFPPR